MAKKRIFVGSDGNIVALYDDEFGSIKDYGKKQVYRASDVEFNNSTSEWEVRIPSGGPVVATAATREEALQEEVKIVERILTNVIEDQTFVHCSIRRTPGVEAIQPP